MSHEATDMLRRGSVVVEAMERKRGGEGGRKREGETRRRIRTRVYAYKHTNGRIHIDIDISIRITTNSYISPSTNVKYKCNRDRQQSNLDF